MHQPNSRPHDFPGEGGIWVKISPAVRVSLCPPFQLPTHPSTHQSICHSFISSSTHPLPVHLPSIHSFIHPPIPRSISSHPSLIPLTYPPTYLTTHQSICHPSFPSSIHPSVCPSACPFIYPLSYLLTWGISLTDNLAKHLSSPRRHCQCMSY